MLRVFINKTVIFYELQRTQLLEILKRAKLSELIWDREYLGSVEVWTIQYLFQSKLFDFALHFEFFFQKWANFWFSQPLLFTVLSTLNGVWLNFEMHFSRSSFRNSCFLIFFFRFKLHKVLISSYWWLARVFLWDMWFFKIGDAFFEILNGLIFFQPFFSFGKVLTSFLLFISLIYH